jgi:hypothetical protein
VFEDAETILEEDFGARNWQKLLRSFFGFKNDDCLAQDRPRELN